MKVYLINAPSDFLLDNKSNLPLGILFVHSYLKKNNVDVSIVDLAGLTPDKWNIPKDGDVYGVSATTPQFEAACKIAEIIKTPDNKVVLGGVHGTCRPEESLIKSFFDMVVRHEGEETMLEIAQGKRIEEIDGISYKLNDYVVRHNKNRSLQKNIDMFPRPQHDAIDMDSYHSNMFLTSDNIVAKGTQIITSRGCSHNCSFCCSPFMYQRTTRFHSEQYIEEWLSELRTHYNSIFLVDDTILVSKKHLEKMCNLFKSKGFMWRASVRGDQVTEEKMKLMYDSGCLQVDIGVESGSQRILNFVNKKEKVEDNGYAIECAHKAGLKVKTSFIVGLPTEQQEDVNQTKDFIRKYIPDVVVLCTFIPFPGCDIGNNPDKYKHVVDKNAPYSQYILQGNCPGSAPVSSGDLNKMTLDFRQQLLDSIKEVSITDSDVIKKRRIE